MKPLCLVRTQLRTETQQELCNIMHDKCEIIISNGDEYKSLGLAHPFSRQQLEEAEIIIGNPSMDTLSYCKNLKWLQLSSSGADAYAKSPFINKEKTIITNATGAYGHAISEYMVAGVFAMTKKLHLYRDNQFAGLWQDLGFVKTINGCNVLVVGLGDIGGNFGKKMNALGANIYGLKRTASNKPDYVKSLHTLDELESLLPQMDVVALCLPNSDKTQDVISDKQLSLMKNDAILVNVGRGNAVNTDALTKALSENVIGGAILDVTQPEPLPAQHPLWKLSNVIITPHVSGGYHAQETIEGIERIILENAQRYVDGQPLSNIVDYETGYMKK